MFLAFWTTVLAYQCSSLLVLFPCNTLKGHHQILRFLTVKLNNSYIFSFYLRPVA